MNVPNRSSTPVGAVPAAVPAAWSTKRAEAPEPGAPGRTRATTTTPSRNASSPRTGRRGLSAVREGLSLRDWQVLQLIAQHRYLTTRQVEGFCFADHASPLTAARVARRVLRRLASVHVISHLERRVGGVRAGSASFVWRVGPVGDRLLRKDDSFARKRQREPGGLFLDHCLAVADAHLALIRAHRALTLELLDVQTEPGCWRPYSGLGGARLVLQPDLYAVTGAGEYEDHWFVEIDRGTENPKRLLAKCAKYGDYRRSGAEQAEHGSFPLVVWVMRDQAQADRLATATQRDRELDARLFRVTTPEQFASLIAGGAL